MDCPIHVAAVTIAAPNPSDEDEAKALAERMRCREGRCGFWSRPYTDESSRPSRLGMCALRAIAESRKIVV